MPQAVSVAIALFVTFMNGLIPARFDVYSASDPESTMQVAAATPAEMSPPDDDHAVAFREARGSLKDMPSPRLVVGTASGFVPPSPSLDAPRGDVFRAFGASNLSELNPRAP